MSMKLVLIFVIAGAMLFADWGAVQRIQPDQKIELTTDDGKRLRAVFLRASVDAISIRTASDERSIARQNVQEIRVADPGRRVRHGLMWMGIGIGAGVGIGAAVCPQCANEGAGDKYIGPGIAIGAGVGALGFLTSPYKSVYRSK